MYQHERMPQLDNALLTGPLLRGHTKGTDVAADPLDPFSQAIEDPITDEIVGEEVDDYGHQRAVNCTDKCPKPEVTTPCHARQRCNPCRGVDQGANSGPSRRQIL